MTTSLPFLPAHSPNDVAALQGGARITAGDLLARGERLAGCMQGTPALVCLCGDRVSVALTLLAALWLDVPCVMPHDHSRETLRHLRTRYRGARFLAERGRFDELDATDPGDIASAAPSGRHAPAFPGERCAAHVFTSGSTGAPRVHEKPWAALAHVGATLGERIALARGTTVGATVPGQHVYGLEASIMLPLQNGGVVHDARPSLPGDVATMLAEIPGPRALVSTPFQLKKLISEKLPLPALAYAISATAPLDRDLATHIETVLDVPLCEMYGTTETGMVATRRVARSEAWQPGPGVALGGTPAAPTVAAPYLAAPVPLGDRLTIDDDGRFHLVGRDADMVKIAGKRGSLGDLSARLLAVHGVADAAIFAPDAEAGEAGRPVAFVVAPGMTPAGIRAALRERVDPAFVPRPIVLLDALPRNEAGKVPRAELERLYRRWRERDACS